MAKISKKTTIIAFLAFFLSIPAAFLLSACGSSHHFSETWTCDQNEHNFPRNIGKYRVKVTYTGGIDPASSKRIMPCSVTTDFSIQ